MGKVVTFASLPYKDISGGVKTAPITGSDGKEMQADVIRLAPGAKLSDKVPQGSDRYLFTLRGETTVTGSGGVHRMSEESFATLQEGLQFTLSNSGAAEAEVISIIALPQPKRTAIPGSKAGSSSPSARRSRWSRFPRPRSAAFILSTRAQRLRSAATR